jgi:hypothetical protein
MLISPSCPAALQAGLAFEEKKLPLPPGVLPGGRREQFTLQKIYHYM